MSKDKFKNPHPKTMAGGNTGATSVPGEDDNHLTGLSDGEDVKLPGDEGFVDPDNAPTQTHKERLDEMEAMKGDPTKPSVEATGPDPWRHRSVGMKCATCMWFAVKVRSGVLGAGSLERKVLGRCRKRAPTMEGYPAVFEDDWCGSHKLDENKI